MENPSQARKLLRSGSMKGKIWALIQDEAQAISGYLDALEELRESEKPEAMYFRMLIESLIADERDHLEALKYLYDHFGRSKPATDSTEKAKEYYTEYQDTKKIIKELKD